MKLKILIVLVMLMCVFQIGVVTHAGSILSLDFTSNGSGDAESYGGAVAGTGNYLADGYTAFVVEELGPSNNTSTDPSITVGGITFAITGNTSAWPGDNIDVVDGTIDPLRGDYLFLPEVDGTLGADSQLTWTVSGLAAGAAYQFTFIHGDNGTRTVTFNVQDYELLIDGEENWTGTLTLVADGSGVITGTATGGTGEGNWAGMVIEVDTEAHEPNPVDGAINVDTSSVLTWKTGLDPANPTQINPAITKHYVWMSSGSYSDPNLSLEETITGTITDTGTYNPGGLARDSKFWWRIDEGIGDYPAGDPNNITGDVWVFETIPSTPAIDVQPQDVLLFAGEDAVFTVDAINPFTLSSDDLAYQWYKAPDTMLPDDPNYSGTTTDTLTVFSVELADEGQYFCRLANTAGNTLSKDTDFANLTTKRLIGYWPFDGDLTDVVGGNDGLTINGDPNYVAGIVGTGQAAQFFGVIGQAVTVATSAHTNLDWTLSWWENASTEGGTNIWESMLASGDNTGWEVFEFNRYQDERYAFGFLDAIYWYTPTDELFDRGQWYSHVVRYDVVTKTVKWYLNGLLYWEIPSIDFVGFDSVIYVANVRSGEQPFKGLIDDLRLYNYAMDATGVAALYFDVAGPYCAARPAMDLSGDCEVTIDDILLFVYDWLQCGRYPECIPTIP